MSAAAEGATIDHVSIGVGYTAVTMSDGGIGIAATGVALNGCCPASHEMADFEGGPASDLLKLILKPGPMGRTMALALINALNHQAVQHLPEDADNSVLFDRFGVLSGSRIAMVGYFPPLVRWLEEKKVPLSVIDDSKGMGDKRAFYRQLDGWADLLLVTATSILNNSTETILSYAGPNLKTVLLGPSTPMLPDAFAHLPIHMLAGTHITAPQQALKIVRHAGGTRDLKPVSRKVYRLTDLVQKTD